MNIESEYDPGIPHLLSLFWLSLQFNLSRASHALDETEHSIKARPKEAARFKPALGEWLAHNAESTVPDM